MHPTKDLVLGTRYTLTSRIALGGMGEVWLAHDSVLLRAVALKILKAELLGSSEFVERFRAEARHAAALTDPGIASVFDYGEDESGAFLVMEFVPGEALSDILARTPILPLTTTLSILAQTAHALAAAHAGGVIHRDVKPGNLMILPDGSVKVTDFGIARAIDAAPLTITGQVVGTPQYMSPEQASGQVITPSTDLYSLGVIGYEMLSGRRPFTGESSIAVALAQVNDAPPPLPASVPVDVRRLIERTLSKRPEGRPASAAVLASELRMLQMASTPPPGTMSAATAAAALGEAHADTAVALDPATSAMPAGKVEGVGPVVVDGIAAAPRQRRRRLAVGIVITAAVIAALAVATRGSRNFDPAAANGQPAPSSPVDAAATTVATPVAAVVSAPVSTVPPPTAPVPTTVATVLIDPQLYVGGNVDDVVAALQVLGVVPDVQSAKGKGRSDTVVSIEPTGPVAPQSTVVVYVGRHKSEGD